VNAPVIVTDAIVIQAIRHTDTTMVVTLLTQELGRIAMVVSSNRRSRKQSVIPLLAPLSLVSIEAYMHKSTRMPRITEIHCRYPLATLHFNAVRRSIAMFISELLVRTLRDEGRDENLYNMIDDSIRMLDGGLEGESNFHILFMYKLASVLGFEPDIAATSYPFFDMEEGCMTSQIPFHRHYLSGEEKALFVRLARADIAHLADIAQNVEERTTLIKILEDYFRLHIPQFEGLNSPYILSLLR
jgi:DNA repair protein RecO (recombination protein O)